MPSGSLIRPKIEESLYPSDDTETSILKMLMESCWGEMEGERPPFAYALEILELITPLKGSQLSKRATLLERETESLERYIGHDTQQLFREQEKINDLISRMLPNPVVAALLRDGCYKPKSHGNITIVVLRVHDLDSVVRLANASQAMDLVSYLWKAIHVIIKNRNLKVTEIQNRGDLMIFGKSTFSLFLRLSSNKTALSARTRWTRNAHA